ncbi:hypothetical protein CONPUDRAFT_92653 [Coniophora puteana RWD-64-598 SS2]|uniref:Nucleoporin n=1 Tax=Coniophora puteana (strain RWD-64-598) TaxID=741705 RepID=A0A5M3MCA0_CONPW|nr:uncharacterized protein CONPUDRAFT_92653 [Coniophora puteana RWD-64-598 SS2]EIW76673.1 hypothetical protein CONPUDRAFT_92653 [Coniophora puteana RWD-64-598 SS2]
MESISGLRNVLLATLGSQNYGEQELFDALLVSKARLLELFEVGPSNPQEQKDLQSGKISVGGRSLAVNADFAQQAIFLAQQLQCSENYVASILHTIMSDNPNTSPEQCMEAAVAEFHQRRRHLADCLRYLFEAAELAEIQDAPRLYMRINAFVQQELIPPAKVGAGDASLAYRIFSQVDALGGVLAHAQTAKQSAVSNTVAPKQGAIPTLGYDILNARYDSLKYERRVLATVYFQIARLGYLSPTDLQKSVDWLSTNPYDPMTFHILSSVLALFDSVDPDSIGGKVRHDLATNKTVLAYMKNKLAINTEWRDSGLKAVLLLRWTLFLTETRHRDNSLESRDGFKTEELETQIWNAVQSGAFTFLASSLLLLQRRTRGTSPTSFATTLQSSSEQDQQREIPTDEFKLAVLKVFEGLVRTLIMYASSELRKIKQRQEDIVLASARTDRSRMFRSTLPSSESESTNAPRNDIAVLYSFIGLLYTSLPPERALQFWGAKPHDVQGLSWMEYTEISAGKLPAFLQWAVWSTQARDVDMTMSLYDMLAGLAKGQQCSELAYNFLARGGSEVIPGSNLPSAGSSRFNAGPTVSWTMIFSLLQSWAAAGTQPRPGHSAAQPMGTSTGFSLSHAPAPSQAAQPQQVDIGPKDVLLAQSFLRLVSTVVADSIAVRLAITSNASFRVVPTLVSLIPLVIPLELKGAVFETLAAMCEPGAGAAGVEVCKTVWNLMERLEVINVRAVKAGSNILASAKGVEAELEEVESVYKLYPATIPFLKLLSTLIHTPKRIALKDRVADTEPLNTIPETLGQSYRLPGIGPYVSFVVDNVFAGIPRREYASPSDRWQMNDLCLCFIERVLASYELEALVVSGDDSQLNKDNVMRLFVHPGFDIMKRILSGTSLQANILSYLVDGVEGFEKEFADEEPHFKSTIVRVLRIVQRVIDIQDIYLDVLIPVLGELNGSQLLGDLPSRSYFTRLDRALSYGPQVIPAIASYTVYAAHPEVVLLAIKIITQLASSTIPGFSSSLLTLIERSPDSERILSGFRERLDVEASDDVDAAEAHADEVTGAGAPDREGSGSEALDQAIRLAVLELLNRSTEPEQQYPNFGHFLLFGGSDSGHQIQDPHAMGAQRTCVHVLLELLNTGVPRLQGKGRSREYQWSNGTPLMVALPALAERCYRVIHHLCTHPRTSDSTMRYLRTREDFFVRHLATLPTQVPETDLEPTIQVMYQDGSRVTTNVPTLRWFLALRSRILDLVALDLHILTNKNHHKGVLDILQILFGNEVAYDEETNGWDVDVFQPFEGMGQSYLKIIDLVQSLNFDWVDQLAVNPVNLELLGHLNLHSCVRVDATGCEVVDKVALLSLLTAGRRALQSQGRLANPGATDKLVAEMDYVLSSCAIENHRREVAHSIASGYESWRRVLDTTLMKCFTRLPHDRRENMLFDLLHVLPSTLHTADIQEPTAILLAEAILSCITKLREDRRHQIMLQSAGGDAEAGSLPTERLYTLLRSILECILDKNRSELVRGNLYAALVNYLHLVAADKTTTLESAVQPFGTRSMSMSLTLSAFSSRDEPSNSLSESVSMYNSPGAVSHTQESVSSLESGTLAAIKPILERLVMTISRDAIDGTEVWKTVAFVALDSLLYLGRSDKSRTVLTALVRYGILSNFARGLKEAEQHLQYVLKPDPDDLNPLYVYEAKMSFFIRMAQSRSGAERLMEAQVLPVLAQCDYLDARPEADESFMDRDSFLPSAVHRYHQLFMPALQLVAGIMATLGSNHSSASHQALDFLSNHRDTISILLKNADEEISLSFIEEIHLLVSLCSSVLPLVPKSDLLSANSGFGSIHGAILSLAARCLGIGHWKQSVNPQTDAELLMAQLSAPGPNAESRFDTNVRRQEALLRKSLVEYLGAASDFTEPEISPVLSPSLALPRPESSRFIGTIPSVGDSIEALTSVCEDLAITLKQIGDLSAELSFKDHIRVDNIQEIVAVSDPSFLQDLDIGQKRSLIHTEYERLVVAKQDEVKLLLGTTEMLLLLLWRHLISYCERNSPSTPNFRLSISTRLASAPEPEVFKSDAGKRIAAPLQKVASLDLTPQTAGPNWESYQGFLEIMSRRLRDTVGLHDDFEP